jgi:hypothetical protein
VSSPVAKAAVCGECGGGFEQPATGRPRSHCSNACKQRAYRKRCRTVTKLRVELAADVQHRVEGVGSAVRCAWFELDREQRRRARDYLECEIERLRRERDEQRRRSDGDLFTNDPGRVLR